MRATLLILIAALLLSACGQKGKLYLPQQPVEVESQEEGKSTSLD